MPTAFRTASCLALAALACRAPGAGDPGAGPPAADVALVRASLDELYRAFCFDAGGEADWAALRALFVEGAAFVAPLEPGRLPRAVGAGQFLSDFQAWVASDAVRATGLYERILHARIDLFGPVAHAYVAFEGYLPETGARHSLGLDSIQLVDDGERWRIVSFTTHYASESAGLPERFLADR